MSTTAALISPDSFCWAGTKRRQLWKLLPLDLQTTDLCVLFLCVRHTACACLHFMRGFSRGRRRRGEVPGSQPAPTPAPCFMSLTSLSIPPGLPRRREGKGKWRLSGCCDVSERISEEAWDKSVAGWRTAGSTQLAGKELPRGWRSVSLGRSNVEEPSTAVFSSASCHACACRETES